MAKTQELYDFINRINPKDINKLQLEGLVKAGAFDNLFQSRSSLYNAIPKIILKSKNNFENKEANQINLFGSDDDLNENFIEKIEEWSFEDKLNKEFESLGFFMSDHPLNAFSEIFDQFKIESYDEILKKENTKKNNLAATILKIQERKTNKGMPYAVIKFSDLSSIFELFVFSDILENNRDHFKEGNSLLLEVSKQKNGEDLNSTRINILKVTSLKDIYNIPIDNIEFSINDKDQLKHISKILNVSGSTNVKIRYKFNDKNFVVKLEGKRLVVRKSLNILKKQDILTTIN